jgi:DNA sulfur modification protein DndB
VGNQLVRLTDPDERKGRARQLAASLSDVSWDRGKKWEGIAGKFTPKGAFARGGRPEAAHLGVLRGASPALAKLPLNYGAGFYGGGVMFGLHAIAAVG